MRGMIGTLLGICLTAVPVAAQDVTSRKGSFDSTRRECLVIGDSLAAGLGQALRNQGMICDVIARKGLTAWQIGLAAPLERYGVAYVSAGSNDPKNPHLEDEARILRSHIRASKIVWVLPYDRTAAKAVSDNAAETGGLVVDMAWWPTRDGIHPADYAPLARMIVR